jgi:hypothetical protein
MGCIKIFIGVVLVKRQLMKCVPKKIFKNEVIVIRTSEIFKDAAYDCCNNPHRKYEPIISEQEILYE